MVRPQHDDGVFRPSGGIELIEKLPDLGVGVGGGRLVGTNETLQGGGIVFSCGSIGRLTASSPLCVSHLIIEKIAVPTPFRVSHIDPNLRHIIQVTSRHRWHHHLVEWIEIENTGRGKMRQVRMENAGSEEQGLVARHILHSFHRPLDGEFIRQLFLHRAPVEIAKSALSDLRFGAATHLEELFERRIGGIFRTSGAMMKNLPRATRAVAVLMKIRWQGHRVGQHLAPGIRVPVDSAGRRAQTGQDRGARGIATG